jgi:hypothetical protein
MANQIILNRTSLDSIALFIQTSPAINVDWTTGSLIPSPLPILLSAGVGIDKFIEIEKSEPNVVNMPSMNQQVIPLVKQVIGNGMMTFSPGSSALVPLRNISFYQTNNLRRVKGILLVFNLNSLLLNEYKDVVWTTPYVGSSRGTMLSDIEMRFQFVPPVAEVNLSTYSNALGVLNGLGISL